jgi:hypothetical protein
VSGVAQISRPQLMRQHWGPPRDPGSIADRDFFLANPGRNYRLRLATQNEAARVEQECGPVPRDWFVYTATKQYLDGLRVRRYFAGKISNFGEEAAKDMFDWLEVRQ